MSTIVQYELRRSSKENVMHLWVSQENLFLCSRVMLYKILTAGLNLGGGVRSFLASQERFLTTLLWMAQLTQ